MSIINNTKRTRPPEAERRANRVKNIASQTTTLLLTNTLNGLSTIWDATSPADVLEELGTDAVESFELSRSLVAYLVSVLSGTDRQGELDVILAKVATIPACTEHPDGTVTIDPVEEEA